MKRLRLDGRLERVVKACEPIDGATFCDVGCDHGKTGCALALQGAKKVVAVDVSPYAIEKTFRLSCEYGVGDVVEARIGDGLAKVDDTEAETVIIAGLGGDTIADIILRAISSGKHFMKYVLVPHTHPEKIRKVFSENNYIICEDYVARISDKEYAFLSATKSENGQCLDELKILFGVNYLHDKSFLERGTKELEFLERKIKSAPDDAQTKQYIENLRIAVSRAREESYEDKGNN